MLVPLQSPTSIVGRALDAFVTDLTTAIPKVLAGVVFLVLAYVLIRAIMFVVDQVVRRTFRGEAVYQQFATTIVKVFLWFGVALSFLSVVGLDDIAASLGTATGFLALGVSYALSGMIADAVAGIYLLRDPDFTPGDTIESGGTEGVIESIELRKTRISVGEDTVVVGNASLESKWTKRDDVVLNAGTEPGAEEDPGAGSEAEAKAEAEAGAETEAAAEAGSEAERETKTGTGEGTEEETTGG